MLTRAETRIGPYKKMSAFLEKRSQRDTRSFDFAAHGLPVSQTHCSLFPINCALTCQRRAHLAQLRRYAAINQLVANSGDQPADNARVDVRAQLNLPADDTGQSRA